MRGYGAHREEYDALRAAYPKQRFLRRKEVAEYLGLTDRKSVAEFLDGVPAYKLNAKEYSYPIEEIAKRIYRARQ